MSNMFERVRTLLARGLQRSQASLFHGEAASSGKSTMQQEAWIRNTLRENKRRSDILRTPLEDLEYVVIDTETTGFRPEHGDEIISVAAVEMKGSQVTGRIFTSYVKPVRGIPPFVTELTGIRKEDTVEAPAIHVVLPKLLEFIGERIIVGFYVGHDMMFLNHYLWKSYHFRFTQRVLETKQVLDLFYPHVESSLLDEVLPYFDIPLINRHTAEGDAKMTARLWGKLIKTCGRHEVRNLEHLYAALSTRRLN